MKVVSEGGRGSSAFVSVCERSASPFAQMINGSFEKGKKETPGLRTLFPQTPICFSDGKPNFFLEEGFSVPEIWDRCVSAF